MEGRNYFSRSKKGFTLIEVLIDLLILSAVATAVITGYFASIKSVELSKAKMTAVALANEKMEILHNMPYDDLATQHGTILPQGSILDNETIDRNSTKFTIKTTIIYVDDPFDGNFAGTIPGKPKDMYPYDYKRIDVTVMKLGRDGSLAKLSSNVSAKAAETSSNTGIISICVIDSNNAILPGATVTIINSTLTPTINITGTTTDDGCLMIPKLPPDQHNNYHIVVTKENYSTDLTFPRTAQNPNALAPDVNVIVQQVTGLTFSIDRFSKMNIHFVDASGSPIPGISFNIEGSKRAYFNPDAFKCSLTTAAFFPTPCDATYTSDAAGLAEIANLEFDDYKIINLSGGYNLISTVPMRAIHLDASTTLEVTAVLSNLASNPSIYSYSPDKAIVGDMISLTVLGGNIDQNATMKIKNQTSGTEIVGTNIDVSPHDKIVADFNLTGAEVGIWDIILANSNGESVTQKSAIEISN